ncbi:MAG: AmmeMemoRadiSam system radical SAM enzyme [bacterium]
MREARWWTPLPDGRILCTLCPRECKLAEGQHAFCYIRKNEGGRLVTLAYGRPVAVQVDPIEKKPLNHFMPGTTVFSMGTAGCNLGCRFCQNWDISKARETHEQAMELSPQQVVCAAQQQGCASIAYTYNDPVIWAEYVIDIAREARKVGIKNVMVTAGYITESAFDEVYEYIDAANVDLKAFTQTFYQKLCFSNLQSVLDTLVWLRTRTKVWFEITNLIIPNQNDSDEETGQLTRWVLENLGDDVPLHFTAFHPDFKMMDTPPTPAATLKRAREQALGLGLKYVYVGNVHDSNGQNTYCPGCGETLISRDWYQVRVLAMKGGACAHCGAKIAGYFPDDVARVSDGYVHPLYEILHRLRGRN